MNADGVVELQGRDTFGAEARPRSAIRSNAKNVGACCDVYRITDLEGGTRATGVTGCWSRHERAILPDRATSPLTKGPG